MKLYLSSYKFGDDPQQLANLYGENKKVAVVVNAWDVYPEGERRQSGIQKEIDGLKEIGLQPELIDLRNYFGKQEELKDKLSEFGGLWVTGGNTFVLRRAFSASGMDSWLRTHRGDNNFVYGGYSAGICVLTKDLKNIEIMDEPNIVPDGYQPEVIWEGVGLVDFAIVPHFQSNHPESEAATRLNDFLISNDVKRETLKDGQVKVLEIN